MFGKQTPGHYALEALETRLVLNAAPTANIDLFLARQATGAAIDGLLLNDKDADGDALTLAGNTNPSNGTLVSNGTGGFTYTPNSGFAGNDAFTYTVSDGTTTSIGQVKIVVSAAMDGEAARTQILNGVTNLFDPTDPRRIAAYGPDAHVIAKDSSGGPMIGAAAWGLGRVIAMNDHQWLEMSREPGSNSTSGQLAQNGIAWLANNAAKNIKIVTYLSTNTTWLQARGFTNVVTATESNLATQLSGAAVFFAGWLGSSEPQANLDAIGAFVRAGGGLFISDYGPGYSWWWGKAYYDAPGNRLLREAGLGFPDAGGVGLTAVRATDHIDSTALFNMLDGVGSYTTAQKDEGGQLLNALYQIIAPTDSLIAQLDLRYNAKVDSLNPTPSTPVSDPFDRAMLNREASLLDDVNAAQVTKHRTSDAVYGAIPAGTPRITRNVAINTNRTRWQPTGMYAAPGELVTVTVPASLVGKGYKIRINAHTDWVGRTSLERLPYVHRSFDITSTTVQVANAFGGAIFIDLGGDAYSTPANLGSVNIAIANAVEHPYFVLGQNTDAQWNADLRSKAGPYGVLVSDNLIIVLPKAQIESANLMQPTALMTWWNNVVAQEDWLAARLATRTGAEMINVDVQQSAGAAHSGYPIQAYQKYWGNLANYAGLSTGGSWGDFHELGHNHQRGWWTFDGGGEVTVNIFSNHAQETMASEPTSGGWGYGSDPIQVMTKALTTVNNAAAPAFDNKDQYPFYFQLADGFGWNKYRDVLRSYELDNTGNPSALPTTNQQEKDQWLIRWSQQTGYNLVNYMVNRWKLEASTAAIAQVNALNLPDWLPAIGGITLAGVVPNGQVTLDLKGMALSYDGVANIANVAGAQHGQLVNNANGTWTYIPTPGYRGGDSFTYDAVSSTGYAISTTVTVTVGGALLETWKNLSGTAVTNLTSSANYPNPPDEATYVGSMEMPGNRADNYGARLRAYLIPSTTGDYTFWIASDDASELWLSTSESAAGATKIAYVSSYTGSREWSKYATQQSAAIHLVAGQRYYIDALMKEGGGSDNLSVAWSSADISQDVIDGAYLEPLAMPNYTPVASGDSAVTAKNSPVPINVLNNDRDTNGDALLIQSFTQATSGIVANLAGKLWYTPNSNFSGNDTFSYIVSDGRSGAASANVVVYVSSGGQGALLETWKNISGSAVSNLTGSTKFPSSPDEIATTSTFEAPSNRYESFGQRMRAYIVPPASGDYTFHIASDDASELWLSADDSPANAAKIASVATYTAAREWTKLTTQKSATITLAAGQKYYIEALMKEGGGADHLAVAWTTPGTTTINVVPNANLLIYGLNRAPSASSQNIATSEDTPTITGNVVSTATDPDGDALAVQSFTQPAHGVAVHNGDGTFTYTPALNYSGSDSFAFTLTDGRSGTSTAAINLTINAINDSPAVAVPIADLTVPANSTSRVIDLSGVFIDADDANLVLWISNNSNPSLLSTSLTGNLLTLTFAPNLAGSTNITVRATDAGGLFAEETFSITALAAGVTGRSIFYNNSYYDGKNPAANAADDAAIDAGKSALLPGAAASFANYTAYSRGINGIMIDVQGLANPAGLSSADFAFKVGNTTTPSTWAAAPAPSNISVRVGGGIGGSDRITLLWPDNAVQKQWLQVTMLANTNTALIVPDLFYFGDAIGETGNSPTNTFVDATDLVGVRDHPRNFLNRAPVTFPYDLNKDSFVDGTDLVLARDNTTNFLTALKLISIPAAAAPVTATTGGAGSGAQAAASESVFSTTRVVSSSLAARPRSSVLLFARRPLDSDADLFGRNRQLLA